MSLTSFLASQWFPFMPSNFLKPLRQHQEQNRPVRSVPQPGCALGSVCSSRPIEARQHLKNAFQRKIFPLSSEMSVFLFSFQKVTWPVSLLQSGEFLRSFLELCFCSISGHKWLGALFTRYPVASLSDLVSESKTHVKHESCPGFQDSKRHLI